MTQQPTNSHQETNEAVQAHCNKVAEAKDEQMMINHGGHYCIMWAHAAEAADSTYM
jgi:hypothetical protein